MRQWPVQNAKARFSELLRAALDEGPQGVTLRGVQAAVVVSAEHWRQLQNTGRRTLKELLLQPEGRDDDFADVLSTRGKHQRRRVRPRR